MAVARWKSGKTYYKVVVIRHACLSTLGSISLWGGFACKGAAGCSAAYNPVQLTVLTRGPSFRFSKEVWTAFY